MDWIRELFGKTKPIIGMCHLLALPGDPLYDEKGGMENVLSQAEKDLCALQDGGVDAVMFSNEFSMPYLTKVRPETAIAMARVIGELMGKIRVPFGVDVLWDPQLAISLAAGVGAKFVRGIFTGAYAGDFGLWDTSVGDTARHARALGADKVKLLYNIVPEAAVYLGGRRLSDVAKSTVFNCHPDAVCVSGLTAGVGTDLGELAEVKKVCPDTPVFANTGVRRETVSEQLSIADGAVVGTAFKFEGKFENGVDQKRVAAFMQAVEAFRAAQG